MEDSLPLHISHVQNAAAFINRSYALFHSIALSALFYYRASYLFQDGKTRNTPVLPWLMVFASELILAFIWLLDQASRWRPISRTAIPERLPEDKQLPSIDVFICTADPNKEPTLEVMNTVVSAMALDYPPEKLYVYVSDDGGSSITLQAMREAWRFATWWLPFCRRYGIRTRCPEAYFSAVENGFGFGDTEFLAARQKIKGKYEVFKGQVERAREIGLTGDKSGRTSRDHPPFVEVIHDKSIDALGADRAEMPLLVYVSREKRPSYPHHFKAGALNVLLRVSGMISNSSYILVLDCDMYCNDPSSARQAMCFHLDPKISHSLAFVQFPQKFHNISKIDIYDSEIKRAFEIIFPGSDGLETPIMCGTGFYIKRKALYGRAIQKDTDFMEIKQFFGQSNEFIKSLGRNYKPSSTLVHETLLLASCSYENHTKWGEEVGFMYHAVVEDFFTGFTLHCKGWSSVYCSPPKPQFLGSATTNLNDVLVQDKRWSTGLVEVGISKFCPIIHGPLHGMSILASMCYGYLALYPFYCLPVWCLSTIPQLCLLNGIHLYPEVSNSFFLVFSYTFLSSVSKHLYEVISVGGSINKWIIEQRIWMIKSATSYLYGTLDGIMKRIGLMDTIFLPTNKVVDDEQVKRYQMGQFDFQTLPMFLVPLVSLVILNMISLVGGVARMILVGDWDGIFGPVFLSFFVVIVNYPIIEGMLLRKDNGRVPPKVTLLSAVFSMIFLSLGSILLRH